LLAAARAGPVPAARLATLATCAIFADRDRQRSAACVTLMGLLASRRCCAPATT